MKKKDNIEQDIQNLEDMPINTSDDNDIESLDSIKKRFEKKAKSAGYIDQGDLLDAVSHLDLTDDDFEQLVQYFKDKNIKVENDEEEDIDEEDFLRYECGYRLIR